jgi:hypothetical protein
LIAEARRKIESDSGRLVKVFAEFDVGGTGSLTTDQFGQAVLSLDHKVDIDSIMPSVSVTLDIFIATVKRHAVGGFSESIFDEPRQPQVTRVSSMPVVKKSGLPTKSMSVVPSRTRLRNTTADVGRTATFINNFDFAHSVSPRRTNTNIRLF